MRSAAGREIFNALSTTVKAIEWWIACWPEGDDGSHSSHMWSPNTRQAAARKARPIRRLARLAT